VFANLGTPELEASQDIAYLWPCNIDAWRHWKAVQTQWRTGMGGATGLDYAGVLAYLREVGMKSNQRKETFEGIRAAEASTLQAWGEKAASDRNNKA